MKSALTHSRQRQFEQLTVLLSRARLEVTCPRDDIQFFNGIDHCAEAV